MEELLERVVEMRADMAQEIDAFTKVSLVMEVQKFQLETMENLLKQHDVLIPQEIQELISDLEQVKTLDIDPGNILNDSAEEDQQDVAALDPEGTTMTLPSDRQDRDLNLIHKQKILNAILKRINRQKNHVN